MSRHSRKFAAVALASIALFGSALTPSEAAATACASANAAPSRAGQAHAVDATVCLLNAIRRHRGLTPLRLNAQLSDAARAHSRDMVRRHYFAHATPEGLSPANRVAGSGYLRGHRRWIVGETLAWGWHGRGTPARIVAAWMNSPPHRHVILKHAFRDIGIGVALGVPRPLPRGGATYTADFGLRR